MRFIWGCLAIPAVFIVFVIASIAMGPTDGFEIGCKVNSRYRVEAVVEVNGRRIMGEATRVNRSERFDYGRLLSWNGCGATKGEALVFRLPDNRALLLRSTLCTDAYQVLDEEGQVNALPICYSAQRRRDRRASGAHPGDAALIDDADAPSEWRWLYFGDGDVEIVALRAERVYWASAADTLEEVAPALLATRFENDTSPNSPAMLILDARRDSRRYEHVATFAVPEADTATQSSLGEAQ